MEGRVIPDVMNDVFYPKEDTLISLREVCQEWGVKKGSTWRTLRVPDWRLGGQGHS